jgi:beta-glucosidase
MTLDEKVGQMVINSRPMGMYQKDKTQTSHEGF